MTWTSAHWTTPDFGDELRDFVTPVLGEDVVVAQASLRPWSAVWTATTPAGRWYLKQNAPPQRHEARLMVALAELVPDAVVPVTAADVERDLLLTPDLGPTTRERFGDGDVDVLCRVAAAGADLQRRVAGASADWGLWTLAPQDAADDLARRVDELAGLPDTDPRRLDPDRAARLRALLPAVAGWGDELAALGLPLTLNHNDLHAHNVVLGPDSDGTAASGDLRFFDYGDAVRTEPLGVLAVPLGSAAQQWGSPDDPRLARVVDAALEVWSDVAPPRALRAAAPAAVRLGRLARAESWSRLVAVMTDEERAGVGSAPAESLAVILEDPPVGARPGTAG